MTKTVGSANALYTFSRNLTRRPIDQDQASIKLMVQTMLSNEMVDLPGTCAKGRRSKALRRMLQAFKNIFLTAVPQFFPYLMERGGNYRIFRI